MIIIDWDGVARAWVVFINYQFVGEEEAGVLSVRSQSWAELWSRVERGSGPG